MIKVDYFRMLEELSALVLSAVSAVCGKGGALPKRSLCEIKCECDKKICALEDALFCEFITPIERDNIAAYAHCLSSVIDMAVEYRAVGEGLSGFDNEEATICVSLAEQLCRDTELLRRMRRSAKVPALSEFRELLRRGREAHTRSLRG